MQEEAAAAASHPGESGKDKPRQARMEQNTESPGASIQPSRRERRSPDPVGDEGAPGSHHKPGSWPSWPSHAAQRAPAETGPELKSSGRPSSSL